MSSTSDDLNRRNLLKNALTAIDTLKAKLDAAEREQREPIAIVGMGCRFPGADSPEAFWELLRDGRSAVREVPIDRWNIDEYFDPDPEAPGKMYARHAGFVDGVDRFDPQFFGISPREAVTLDPQQRMVLEVSWQALESAAQAPDRLRDTRTGVYVGIGGSDYAQLVARSDAPIDAYTGSGGGVCFAAGRLSYVLSTPRAPRRWQPCTWRVKPFAAASVSWL
jgi:acyl transferase domain-containing protein